MLEPGSLSGKTVIVVDVLRATTTIIHALSNGATQVLPQPSVESARTAFADCDGSALIGGERGGKIVDGFHHGNSPIEYTSEIIAGKTLILATTNGTVAMERCRAANRVLIGAMINVGAVAELVKNEPAVLKHGGFCGSGTGIDCQYLHMPHVLICRPPRGRKAPFRRISFQDRHCAIQAR